MDGIVLMLKQIRAGLVAKKVLAQSLAARDLKA